MDVIATVLWWLVGAVVALPIAALIIVKPIRHTTTTIHVRTTTSQHRPTQTPWPTDKPDTRVERYRAGAAR